MVRLLFLLTSLIVAGHATATAMKGHLRPIGESGPNHPIDVVDGFLPPRDFITKYLREHRPIVFRGAVKDSSAFRKWTDPYFRSKTPAGKEGNVFVEYGKKENRSDPSEDIHFLKFLDTYNTSDMYMVHHVPTFLAPDVIMPFCIQCGAFNKSFKDTVMWFSSGGTKSVFHNDGFENINCLYRGRKHLVIANATQYEHLMPRILDVRSGGHSSVDVERVDLDKYPFFKGMDFHIADMEAGDCLYIPLAWLHHVTSFGSNLAVNVWFSPNDVAKIDLDTCKTVSDERLTLDKFNYPMAKEGEEEDEGSPASAQAKATKETKGKNKASSNTAIGGKKSLSRMPLSAQFDLIIDNLADVTMGRRNVAPKATFITNMAGRKKLTKTEAKLLQMIFKSLDSNSNDRFDMDDFEQRLPPKKLKTVVAALIKWQKVADKYNLGYNLLSDKASKSGGSAERLASGKGDSSGEESAASEGEANEGREESSTGRGRGEAEREPILDPEVYESIGSRDEL